MLNKSPYFKDILYCIPKFDLESQFPNCKIVKYADLEQYQHIIIYDILPNQMDFCFILTESKFNVGHWTVLIRNGSNFEYLIRIQTVLNLF
jgi:hypothetical protein